jgi:hypothetical protein
VKLPRPNSSRPSKDQGVYFLQKPIPDISFDQTGEYLIAY